MTPILKKLKNNKSQILIATENKEKVWILNMG